MSAGCPQILHEFSFDPAYGFSIEDLRTIRHTGEEPKDFDVFWRSLRRKADLHPREVSFRELPSPHAGVRLLEARYAVWPGYHVGAWVRLPENPADVCGVRVVGHGYSGRESPDEEPANPRHLTIFPVAPGFGISRNPGIPSDSAALHVVHGIENPETYILGSCVSALWGALDVAEVLLGRPVVGAHYVGWSFGGGLGALMLPWESRFASAELGQPTFGNHPFRLSVPCVGSGESVRQKFLRDPGIAQALAYYDAAFAVRRLRIPVVFACARFDPAVPPPGQFTVANECGSLKFISEFLVGHFDFHHPAEADELAHHRKNLDQMQNAVSGSEKAPSLP